MSYITNEKWKEALKLCKKSKNVDLDNSSNEHVANTLLMQNILLQFVFCCQFNLSTYQLPERKQDLPGLLHYAHSAAQDPREPEKKPAEKGATRKRKSERETCEATADRGGSKNDQAVNPGS